MRTWFEIIDDMKTLVDELDEKMWRNIKEGVSIVRCNDCNNNKKNTDGVAENWCYKLGFECNDDGYCNFGEMGGEE